MKQILFMMPGYYNFDEVVKDGLQKYSGYEVNGIDTVGKQAYRNTFDRIVNFLSKVFLNKNLKPEMKRKLFFHQIDQFPEYEYLIVNRPDILTKEVLLKARSKSKKTILLLWDSLEKIPTPAATIELFDVTYSFDKDDCAKYGFKKIENFHFFDEVIANDIQPIYDVVFLGTLDKRIDSLSIILDNLRTIGKKGHAYIYVPSRKSLKKHADIEVLTSIVPFKESYTFALSGKVILDLAHENQRGLSFRVFEAMAFEKKLITNNQQIKSYEFYNEHNIFVIDHINHIEIPESFWNTPYQKLPVEIVDKYNIKNWVKRILDEK